MHVHLYELFYSSGERMNQAMVNNLTTFFKEFVYNAIDYAQNNCGSIGQYFHNEYISSFNNFQTGILLTPVGETNPFLTPK